MKKVNILLTFITITVAALVACTSGEKSSDVAEDSGGSWPQKMRGLATHLEQLFPFVASKEEFLDTKNSAKISRHIQEFEKSVQVVPKHVGEAMLGKDPIVNFTINRMLANTQHARAAFDEGHKEFARNLLKENMSMCFSCHTTNQLGPENSFSSKKLSGGFRITTTEKAYYYVATRQFDRASEVLESSFRNPVQTNADLHEQIGALQQYLAIQVRVEKNPKNAITAVENFIKINQLPYFISTDVKSWLRSLKEWQLEMARARKSSVNYVQQARRLISFANRVREDEGYQSGFVDYLRATAVLHEGLRYSPTPAGKAEIYHLLGVCYETLAQSGTWELPEVYFEACIRTNPKTTQAQKCYVDYERVTIMGFSGSAGIFLPKSERLLMDELKKLSGL